MSSHSSGLRRGGGARQGVGGHKCTCVVFHAVDAVGVSGQRPHTGLALQGLCQAQAKLTGPATSPAGRSGGLGADGHGGFTPAQDHTGFGKRLATLRHGPRQCSMHLAHFA